MIEVPVWVVLSIAIGPCSVVGGVFAYFARYRTKSDCDKIRDRCSVEQRAATEREMSARQDIWRDVRETRMIVGKIQVAIAEQGIKI